MSASAKTGGVPAPAAPDGPLTGLLVVDLSRVLAGPFATMMLADLGARVVKVERPGTGDDTPRLRPVLRRPVAVLRAGQPRQGVRGARPARPRRARRRARDARAGRRPRRELPARRHGPPRPRAGAAVRAAPRGWSYCSISGFGQTGPWSQRPAYDAVVQAMSGLMAITGPEGGPATKPGAPVADLSAGLHAFGGICAALLGRARTGRGTALDIAMYDATVSLLEGPALSWLSTGTEPGSSGNAHFSIAPFDVFACADRADHRLRGQRRPVRRARAGPRRPRAAGRPALRHQRPARPSTGTRSRPTSRRCCAPAPPSTGSASSTSPACRAGPISTVGEAVGSPQTAARRMVVDAGGLPVPGNRAQDVGVRRPGGAPGRAGARRARGRRARRVRARMSLLAVLDLLGVFVFALSGATLAVARRLDLFGVLVLGIVAATGGGLLRDVLLGDLPAARAGARPLPAGRDRRRPPRLRRQPARRAAGRRGPAVRRRRARPVRRRRHGQGPRRGARCRRRADPRLPHRHRRRAAARPAGRRRARGPAPRGVRRARPARGRRRGRRGRSRPARASPGRSPPPASSSRLRMVGVWRDWHAPVAPLRRA